MENLFKDKKMNSKTILLIILSMIGRIALFFPTEAFKTFSVNVLISIVSIISLSVLSIVFWSKSVKSDIKNNILLFVFISDQLLFLNFNQESLMLIDLLFVFLLILQLGKNKITVFVLPVVTFISAMIHNAAIFDYIPLMLMIFWLYNRNKSKKMNLLVISVSLVTTICAIILLGKISNKNTFSYVDMINNQLKAECIIYYLFALIIVSAFVFFFIKNYSGISSNNKKKIKKASNIKKYNLKENVDIALAVIIFFALNVYGFYQYPLSVSSLLCLGTVLFIWSLLASRDDCAIKCFDLICNYFKEHKTASVIVFVVFEVLTTVLMIKNNSSSGLIAVVTNYM